MSCLLLSMLAWLKSFSEISESKSLFCKNSSYFVGVRKAEKASLPYQFFLLAFYEDTFYECFREYNKDAGQHPYCVSSLPYSIRRRNKGTDEWQKCVAPFKCCVFCENEAVFRGNWADSYFLEAKGGFSFADIPLSSTDTDFSLFFWRKYAVNF